MSSTSLSSDSPSDHTNSDHESDCSSEHTESPLAQGGNLQEEEIKILEADIDQWKSANKNKRITVVTCIRSKIKNLEANKTLKTHEWAIQSWLYNHSQGHTQKALLRYGRAWTTRTVIMHQQKKDINLVLEKAGIKQGSAQMIKEYQKVVDKVMETLTEEEKAEAEELAKKWNKQHPPLDVQAKNAKKKGKQYAKEFAKEMWKWCGARVVVMVALKDNHGELEHCWQKFAQYSRITFDTDNDGKESNTNNKPRNLMRKSKARPQVSLPTHDNGTPYIPSILDMHVPEMKDIMRAFVTFHYRKASGKPTATVPWGAIAGNTSTYVAFKYLPHDVTFKEPTCLTQDEVTRMLELWRD
ncbi:hypothetical protein V8B97DRAFT_2024128 [Scleroderma yunnanense]